MKNSASGPKNAVSAIPVILDRLCFFGDPARVSIVWFAGNRIDYGANEAQGGFGIKDINPCGGRIRNDEHVGGVDCFPAAYARAVETQAVRKYILAIFVKGGGEMCHVLGRSVNLKSTSFTPWSLIILLTSDGVLSLAIFKLLVDG